MVVSGIIDEFESLGKNLRNWWHSYPNPRMQVRTPIPGYYSVSSVPGLNDRGVRPRYFDRRGWGRLLEEEWTGDINGEVLEVFGVKELPTMNFGHDSDFYLLTDLYWNSQENGAPGDQKGYLRYGEGVDLVFDNADSLLQEAPTSDFEVLKNDYVPPEDRWYLDHFPRERGVREEIEEVYMD